MKSAFKTGCVSNVHCPKGGRTSKRESQEIKMGKCQGGLFLGTITGEVLRVTTRRLVCQLCLIWGTSMDFYMVLSHHR